MRQRARKLILLVVAGCFVSWIVMQTPALTQYVETVKNRHKAIVTVSTHLSEDMTLKQRIKKAAETYSKLPVEPRIDEVWKAIPGYNGLVVDIERTLKLAKQRGDEAPLRLVFREVSPKNDLEDLSPNPIYRGNPQKPAVALMINVAWGTAYLPSMLDILEQERVHATFFLDGSWLAKHPNEARKLVNKGHEIANHAYHHPQMSQLTPARMKQEIVQTEKLIQQTLGVRTSFFAPPSGDYNQQVIDIAADLDLKTVLWTADTVDWRTSSTPAMMIKRIKDDLGNGTLILMHPTDRTVQALPDIIQLIKQKGLRPGTVREALSPERIPRIEPHLLF